MNPRSWITLAWLAALGACASTPQLPPIRDRSTVALKVSASAPAQGPRQIENTALGHDTSAGAKTGAVAGGLWGFACGPFAFVCVPAAAGIGALYGTVAGAGIGLTGALSNEKATRLRQRLERLELANPPVDTLRRHVEERARQHWRIDGAEGGTSITIELQEIVLTSTRDEQIGLVLHVVVSTRQGGAADAVAQKLYEHVGPTTSLAVWLDENNDFIDTSIRLALQQLAHQIVSELARA